WCERRRRPLSRPPCRPYGPASTLAPRSAGPEAIPQATIRARPRALALPRRLPPQLPFRPLHLHLAQCLALHLPTYPSRPITGVKTHTRQFFKGTRLRKSFSKLMALSVRSTRSHQVRLPDTIFSSGASSRELRVTSVGSAATAK